MSRERHIDTRNLIVANTFDEFAEKVGKIDRNVEDIVGYVTSVSRVFYWLNVESVWGVLGFTWEPSSLSILEGADYVEEMVEHVESNGEIIDYSTRDAAWKQAHAVTKGYGYFNATTMPFTVIPQLPDGYRITQFRNTFNLIESDYIEVQKSDWRNLIDINYLVRQGQSIKIDITGANLNNDSKVIIDNTRYANSIGTDFKATIYIKGHLSNCTSGVLEYDNLTSWTKRHTILLDDDNKRNNNDEGLGLPISLRMQNQFYYTNPDEVFDIKDWLTVNTPASGVARLNMILLAASKNYHIDNAFVNLFRDAGWEVFISPLSTQRQTPDNFEGWQEITNPITKEIEPDTITVDCTQDGSVREDLLFMNNDFGSNEGFRMYLWNSIQYIDTPSSITMWNPFSLVRDDNDWPEYSQSIIDKLIPIPGESWSGGNYNKFFGGYFMYGSYIYITKPSPYTIDCTNIRQLNLFEKTHFYVSDYTSFREITNGRYALEIVQLINPVFDKFAIGVDIGRNVNGDRIPRAFYFTLPSLETIWFADNYAPSYFIPATSKITFNHWYTNWGEDIFVEDFTTPHFKIKYIDARELQDNLYSSYSFYFTPGYGITEVGTTSGPVNLFEFDSEILAGTQESTEYLKASHINTVVWGNTRIPPSREIIHPFIAVGTNVSYNDCPINISSSFIFIYKANITIEGYNDWADTTAIMNAFLTKILPAIQPNDTDTGYMIKLSDNLYRDLETNHPTEFNYITNTLNYQLGKTSR